MKKQTRIIIITAITIAVALGLTALLLISQSSSDLTIEAPAPPRAVTLLPLPPSVLSTIAVKAELPLYALETLAEAALKDYLTEPIRRKDGVIESFVKLTPGTLRITSTANGTAAVRIPFQFSGSVGVSKEVFGTVIRKHEEIRGQATISLTLTPALNPNWRITAKTAADISIQKAEVEILSIKISIRSLLTKIVKDKVLPKLEDILLDYIQNIDIKPQVANLWSRLYEPIHLKQDPPIALVIEPLKILAQELSSDGQTLALSFGINTYIQAHIGDTTPEAPVPKEKRTDLPDILFVDTLDSGYHIIAPIEITYTAIETLAKPYVEKAHKLKGIRTLVENLVLYGSGTQLVAGLKFTMPTLRARGQLYLLGTPTYDATTMSIAVTQFDYALTTQNLILDLAEAAGDGFFPNLRTTVEARLVFPLENHLQKLHSRLADAIAERSIGNYIRLRGTVDTITPETLHLTQTGVHIRSRLQGDLTCQIILPAPTP